MIYISQKHTHTHTRAAAAFFFSIPLASFAFAPSCLSPRRLDNTLPPPPTLSKYCNAREASSTSPPPPPQHATRKIHTERRGQESLAIGSRAPPPLFAPRPPPPPRKSTREKFLFLRRGAGAKAPRARRAAPLSLHSPPRPPDDDDKNGACRGQTPRARSRRRRRALALFFPRPPRVFFELWHIFFFLLVLAARPRHGCSSTIEKTVLLSVQDQTPHRGVWFGARRERRRPGRGMRAPSLVCR